MWCAGMEAGRPSVELACRLGGDHAARSSSCCLSVRCWLSAHDRTSLIASSWTSARCAASGPRTRTISTELVSRRDRDRGERATVSPTGSSCSSSAAAIRLQTTRRIPRSRRPSPDVRPGHGQLPSATDRPPPLHGRSIHAVCQVSSRAQPRLCRPAARLFVGRALAEFRPIVYGLLGGVVAPSGSRRRVGWYERLRLPVVFRNSGRARGATQLRRRTGKCPHEVVARLRQSWLYAAAAALWLCPCGLLFEAVCDRDSAWARVCSAPCVRRPR